MYFEEEFAYPTNLTSRPMVPDNDDEDEDCYYEQDQLNNNRSQGKDPRVDRQEKSTATATAASSRSVEIIGGNNEDDERLGGATGGIGEGKGGHYSQCHPSRVNNSSTGSDLIQVTVEDLLISKEQSRTIKASIDLARQESSRPSVLPIVTSTNKTTATTTTTTTTAGTGAAVSPTTKTVATVGSSTSSPPSSPVPAITTTTITATIRTIGGRGTSFLFDGDIPPTTDNGKSSPSQLSSASTVSPGTVAASGTVQGQQQGQGLGVSKNHGISQQQPQKPAVVPLTPAQQREAEADDNIQRAIELHERNQLQEATHYFRLAAQSENPLGQLMYGLSLRHGWVSYFFFQSQK